MPRGDAIVGGRYLAIASLEYQHRLTDAYSLAAFVDYGNAGDSRSDFDPVAGYGLGLRWRTPIGPVRIDLAYSVNSPRFMGLKGTREQLLDPNLAGVEFVEQRISRFQFHFSLGQLF